MLAGFRVATQNSQPQDRKYHRLNNEIIVNTSCSGTHGLELGVLPDILVPRNFLLEHEEIHESMTRSGGSALVSCVRKNVTHEGVIEEGRKSAWGHKLDRFLSLKDWSEINLEPEQTLSQATFLKRDWERVGHFDVDFDGHWGFDEIEFAYRLKKAGIRLTCHGLVYHIDEGPGAGNRDESRNSQLYRNKTAE